MGIVFCLLMVLPMVAQEEELCRFGTLLFREDFGGNDPSDPAVGRTPVSGMSSSYQQIYTLQTSDPGAGMGSGCYLVAKRGYRNSTINTYSVWHIMDDHTYFGDTTRGYLLEIDGTGRGNDVFYSTEIQGLCAGSKLTFSAYVANLTTAGQYNGWRNRNYVHPKLTFVLTHPQTGAELARYNTDTIAHDWSLFGTPSAWKYTANWQLVGMNFTVPEGVDAVRLSIRNNASGSSTGNDFAMDDIEIRLCTPPVFIDGETEVCENAETVMRAEFANDGTFAEPLAYKWWFSADSLTWTELSETTNVLTLPNRQKADSGWYRVAVSGAGNIESINCRAMSEPFHMTIIECEPPEPILCTSGILLFREDFGGNNPSDPRVSTTPVSGMTYSQSTSTMGSGVYMVTKSGYCNGDTTGWTIPGADRATKRSQWYIQDDHTYPNDYTRGYFMEIDGKGGNQQFYQTEINGLCEGIELTFSAYVANVFTWFQYDWYTKNRGPVIAPCLKFVLTNPQTGETLAEKNTQEIPFDEALPALTDWQYSSAWHLVGMNFTVPVGVNAIRLSIYNNVTNGNGNDFAIDDIEVHLCMTPDTILTDTTVCDTTRQIRWREKTFAIADTLRDTLFSTCGFDSIYYVMHVEKEHCEHALCTDGILLFREDFGGNNPSDPKISTTPVPGMSYTQATTDVLGSMGAGKYLVTKQGYCNGNGTSQWHLQDDHTHLGDLTRGYFMEIDGRAGSDAFYRTTIDHLCEGIELTFSAYVANVMTWGMYVGRPGMYAYPRLKFVLTDPTSNTELATYDTGDIPFDSTFIGDNMCWQQSVEWRLVGMNFTVPVGVETVQLSIYNNVSNSNGNDFAIDDIEVHLCMTPDTIRTDTTVCDTIDQIAWRGKEYAIVDTLRDTLFSTCGFDSIYYILHVETEHCEVPEPPFCMGGTLLFREDFGGNGPSDPMVSRTPMPGISSIYQQDYNYSAGRLAGMHYIIAKQGHPDSDFHAWHIMDDHTCPNDPTRGYFFETNSRANSYYTNYIYQKEVAGLCAGMELSFSAYFANVVTAREFKTVPFWSYSYPKFVFVVTDARTGEQLARYNTDTIGHDWSLYNIQDSWQYSAQWHLEGIKFTIPEGVDKVTLSIIDAPTQYGNAEGDDYAVDDIELHLCSNVEYQTVDTTICDTLLPFSWRGIEWIKADTIGKIYKDAQGNDSLYLVYSLRTIHCPYPPVSVSQDTTICDTLSQIKWHDKLFPITHEIHDTVYDAYGYDSAYYTLRVAIYHCPYPPVTISSDTTICDTLSQIAWRDKIYAVASELRDTLYESYGADSVYFVLNISTQSCCPYMIRGTEHYYTCDTLMPYIWHGFGDSAVIAEEGEHIIEIPSKRWPDCIAYRITVILNVEHCERKVLYPIIVNKYNWQLLLDNVKLRQFFLDRTALTYQWYKDELPVAGATDDDYSEQNELHGRFQLRIELDGNQTIWSNILEINTEQAAPLPVHVRIYNSHGMPVAEDQVTHGIYLYRYEQGNQVWTEKRFFP